MSPMITSARRVAALLALSFAFLVGAAALPAAQTGPLAQLAPATASAATTGITRDYIWMKISRAEVASGLAGPACVVALAPTVIGVAVCPLVAWVASRYVGAGGLQVKLYFNGRLSYAGY